MMKILAVTVGHVMLPLFDHRGVLRNGEVCRILLLDGKEIKKEMSLKNNDETNNEY